jgi:4-amino-4-deoxy-L-arabinose transferase-like glycosyltransferase
LATEKYYPPILISFSVLLFFFGLGWRDFWAPVEPRYAEIARVMFSKGEWIVPTVNGDLYTDKPILYFWLVLFAGKIFGAVNEWTVRLPAALGGVGVIWATYLLGKEFFAARVGFLSAVVLATSVRVIWEARWAHTDMVFNFFFALSLYFAMHWLFRRSNPYEILLTYVFMALATLAKGLIGIVLPALILIPFMLARRDWRLIIDAKMLLGIPIFMIVVSPWFFLVTQATDGKWLTDFLYIHHWQRYTAGAGHRQPFYYYLTTLPVDLLPWTIFTLPALLAYRPFRRIWRDPVLLFFVIWFLSVLLFFSASDTKRELYLLPLLPVLALLIGNYFNDLSIGAIDETRLFRWLASINFAIVVIVGVALPAAAWVVRRDAFWFFVPGSLAMAVGGAIVVRFFRQRQPLRALTSIALMMTLLLVSSAVWVFPYLEQFKSRRSFTSEIKRRVPATAPLYIYEDTMNDFNYYLERDEMPVLWSPAEIEKLLGGARTSYVLIKDRDFKRLKTIAPEWIVLTHSAGSTTWNLVEFKPPAG